MKLYSPQFYRRLQRGVRREVKTKREWRQTARSIRRARPFLSEDQSYLRALALPVVLSLSKGFETPVVFWFSVVLWMTFLALLRTTQIQQLAFGNSRPTPLLQLPVASPQVWKQISDHVFRASWWLFLDVAICFGIARQQAGTRSFSMLAGMVPAAILIWVSVLSLCILLFWKFPRATYAILTGVVGAIWVTGAALFRSGVITERSLQQVTSGFMWLTPAGWACQFLAWCTHARNDFPVVATVLLVLSVALAVPGYRAVAKRYVFWPSDEAEQGTAVGTRAMAAVSTRTTLVERPAMEMKTSVAGEDDWEPDLETEARVAQIAALSETEARIRSGDLLQPQIHAGHDLLDDLILPRSRRETVVLDYLLGRAPRWGARYRRGLVTLLVGMVGVMLFKPVLGPLTAWALVIICISGLGLMTPLFGGSWRGFAVGSIPPRLVPLPALWPIGLTEIRDAILRVNVRRFGLALPGWLLAGGLGALVWDASPVLGLRYAFSAWLMFLLFQPATLICRYSSGTNDTTSGFLNALAISGMILSIPVVAIWTLATVMIPAAWWWQATAFTSVGMVSFGSEALYRWLYNRQRFDLLAKAPRQG